MKHMLRLNEERQAVELERKELDYERKTEKGIAEVKDTYRDKLEVRLEGEVKSIKEMYAQILTRLPDVNVALGSVYEAE